MLLTIKQARAFWFLTNKTTTQKMEKWKPHKRRRTTATPKKEMGNIQIHKNNSIECSFLTEKAFEKQKF